MKTLYKNKLTGFLCLLFIPIFLTSQFLPYNEDLDSSWYKNSYIKEISKNKAWILINESSDYKDSRELLINRLDSIKIDLGSVQDSKFSNNNNFLAFINTHSELKILNLLDLTFSTIENCQKFEFNHEGTFLASLIKNNLHSLVLKNLKNDSKINLSNIMEFYWPPQQDRLVAVRKNKEITELINISMKGEIERIDECDSCIFSSFKGNEKGDVLVYLKTTNSLSEISWFNYNQKSLKRLSEEFYEKFPRYSISNTELDLSSDGKTVFFNRESLFNSQNNAETIEIWDTEDVWIYPRKKEYEKNIKNLLTLWKPESNTLRAIEDEKFPSSKAKPDLPFAVIYNLQDYEPQYEYRPYTDYYLLDLNSGSKKILAKKVYSELNFINISPKGNYILYFYENDWWLYDISKEMASNISNSYSINWESENTANFINNSVREMPLWSDDGKYAILHDSHNIWLFHLHDKSFTNITQEFNNKISYTVFMDKNNRKIKNDIFNSIGPTINLKNSILIKMNGNDLKTGFAIWNKKDGIVPIYYDDMNIEIQDFDFPFVITRNSRFNKSFSFSIIDCMTKKKKLFYQSNPNFSMYDVGNYKIFQYYSPNNEKLNGVLIYPSNFDSSKKYPMIVWIYENNSNLVNKFITPSEYSPYNFNIYKYILNNYFVLLPDIAYSKGNPGFSALYSVNAAIDELKEIDSSVNLNSIGLIGFSFGGYEAAFISTQTNRFKAIVAGASMTDMTSFYHDIAWDWKTEQSWRLESQQFRMGDSYYNLKQNYYMNSPLFHVENVQTPILLWTGQDDYNINWYQSILFYNALKRLNKKGKLLLFKDEKHGLDKMENLNFLSTQVFDWFETYLK